MDELERAVREFERVELEEKVGQIGAFELPKTIDYTLIYNAALGKCKERLGPLEFPLSYFIGLSPLFQLIGKNTKGMKVLDIGCGSPVPGNYDTMLPYPPVIAEVLTQLGAEVTGVDFRPNNKAGYDHRVLDFIKGEKSKVFETIKGDYDIVIAHRLTCMGLKGADEGIAVSRVNDMIGSVAKPNQLALTDIDLQEQGFVNIIERPYDSSLWYKSKDVAQTSA